MRKGGSIYKKGAEDDDLEDDDDEGEGRRKHRQMPKRIGDGPDSGARRGRWQRRRRRTRAEGGRGRREGEEEGEGEDGGAGAGGGGDAEAQASDAVISSIPAPRTSRQLPWERLVILDRLLTLPGPAEGPPGAENGQRLPGVIFVRDARRSGFEGQKSTPRSIQGCAWGRNS